MNGKTLKERIAQLNNMTYTDIAKRLNVSEQSMYQYFLVNDVKSGLIERICEIIGVDISTMYGIEPVQGINHNAGDVITKEIGTELGIERLQFYAARHSWATIARNDLHIGKDTINEALNHVDSTMAVTDTYIRRSFDNLNEANRLVVDYIVGLKIVR